MNANPLPELPPIFSKNDCRTVIALIEMFDKDMEPYSGDWTSPWLNGSAHQDVWIIKMPNNTFRELSWDVLLPDGSSLTDDKNEKILRCAQQILFLMRELPQAGCGNNGSLLGTGYTLISLIKWMFVNDDLYKPEKYAFRRLNTEAMLDFIGLYRQGGVPWLLYYPQFLLSHLFESALGTAAPASVLADVFSVSESDVNAIVSWLKENHFYRKKHQSQQGLLLDKGKIAECMGWDIQTIKSHNRFNAFLRQFEPDGDQVLLVGREVRREFPSHRVQPLSEMEDQPYEMNTTAFVKLVSDMIKLQRNLPDQLPESSSLKVSTLWKELPLKRFKGTPWIPLEVALKYTTESLRWVITYGQDIVDSYLEIVSSLNELGAFDLSNSDFVRQGIRRRFMKAYKFPASLAPLNIDGYESKLAVDGSDYSTFRQSPAVADIVSILFGAVFLLVSYLKPIRDCEVRALRNNSVLYRENDGYWIRQEVAKKKFVESRPNDLFPIPRVVAEALNLVKQFVDGIGRIFPDAVLENDRDYLFLMLDIDSVKHVKLYRASPMRMNRAIDRFSDWVNLPTDDLGRRWYPRVHEDRKCFLISFFWCFRYSGLEAARWIAGHKDTSHLYAYIQANFPGDELPGIEAEYAAQQLWTFESGGRAEAKNVQELYASVKLHFQVASISLISEQDMLDWLEVAFVQGKYRIEPYSIGTHDGVIATEICFKVVNEDE